MGQWRALKKSPTIKELSLRDFLQFVGFTYCSVSEEERSKFVGAARLCSVWGKSSREGKGAELDQGPLKRSSSLLVRIDIKEVINKEEMRWRKFWPQTCHGV